MEFFVFPGRAVAEAYPHSALPFHANSKLIHIVATSTIFEKGMEKSLKTNLLQNLA
jgi:hypothetical protein